jgi:hypothetical protein
VLATLREHVEVGGDAVQPYVLPMNSHDGSTAVVAATTPIRVVAGKVPISVGRELPWDWDPPRSDGHISTIESHWYN